MYDQAQTGNPRHVTERLAAGGKIIEFRLHVETNAGAIGIGSAVLSELWRLFRCCDAADSARGCSQTLGGNSEPDERITEEAVQFSNRLRRVKRLEPIDKHPPDGDLLLKDQVLVMRADQLIGAQSRVGSSSMEMVSSTCSAAPKTN